MVFFDNGKDEVVADYTVSRVYEGYPGVVHGGVQAAILDEIVGRVSLIDDFHQFMMSVRLEVKYRHKVPVEVPLRIIGRRESLRGKYGQAHGMIYLPDGTLATEAAMILVQLPKDVWQAAPAELGWRVDF